MYDFSNEIYRMWRPDLHEALRAAIRQKKSVSIQIHWRLDDCNTADLTLHGRFSGLTGLLVQFVVLDFDPVYGNAFPAAPECEYSFIADLVLQHSEKARIEYNGRAVIIDQELQKNDLPESLLLRLSPANRIRRLRRHQRQSCPASLFLMPGLMLMDQEPINRRRLLALLGHYYHQKNRPKPELVDISAGGVCLLTNDQRCKRFMGAEESYLFFFFTEVDGMLSSPSVFMGKKVGIYRGGDATHAGLRIRFLKELVWTSPNEDLKWKDISSDGSENIKKMIEEWNRQNQPVAVQSKP